MYFTIISLLTGLLAGCTTAGKHEAGQQTETDNIINEETNNITEEPTEQPGEEPQEETPPPPNPYPDGIVRHNPETYLIETWGVYNDEFERPDIEVPVEAIERLGQYALEWPEYIDKVKEVRLHKWGEGIEDRYFYWDTGFVTFLEAYPDLYEMYKRWDEEKKNQPSNRKSISDILGISSGSYVEDAKKMHEGEFYKVIKTDKYEYEAEWDSNRGYYYIIVEGKDWVPNKYQYKDKEFNEYKLYRGDGAFKFHLDDEAIETIKFLLSNALKREEVRLVIMKLKEIEEKVNKAMETKGIEYAPYDDMEELKTIYPGYRDWPYIYHMYFDTYMSVSFALSYGGVVIDMDRWKDNNVFVKYAEDYCTGANLQETHKIASGIQKHLGIELTR